MRIPRRWARQGACIVGLFASELKKAKSENEGTIKPLELSEGNVQAIFNRCLATEHSQEQAVGFYFRPLEDIKKAQRN